MPIMTTPACTRLSRSLLALLFAIATTAAVAAERRRRQAPPADAQHQGEQQQGVQRGDQRPAQRPQGERQQGDGQSVLRLLPADSVTQHTVDTPGGKIDYAATAGTLSLYDQSGERTAAIFYTAYVAKGGDTTKRPVTFVFNGGARAARPLFKSRPLGPRLTPP